MPISPKRHPVSILLAACLLAPLAAQADAPASRWQEFQNARQHGRSSHMLEIDNDSLLFRKRDGFYTSGVRYTWQTALRDSQRVDSFGWRIGQDIYTASDINLAPAEISPNDHPYAGWLYGGVFRATHTADGGHLRYGLDLGCLGPCAGGRWAQERLHSIIDQPPPRGWSSQLRNEFGAVLYADYAPRRWQLASWADATPNLHARFGNIFTDAGAGLLLRAGRLNLLPDEATLHGFARLDARAVGYNATLQGGYFSGGNPHTVAPKRLVGQAEIGIAWSQGPFAVAASIVRRSSEIRDLSNAVGAENFARLMFSYTPR
ncbi:MAG: lipid A deacylase LpxR family protein [Burkholderiaceae bacterium]